MASREAEFASRPEWWDICRPARVGDERSCPPFSNVGAISGKPFCTPESPEAIDDGKEDIEETRTELLGDV